MQAGTVSRLWFRWRSRRFEIHFWRNTVHFRKSYICSNKLDVQETNCCFAQLNIIWNYLFDTGLRLDGLPALELWDLIFLFLEAWLWLQTERCDLLMLKEVKNLKGRSMWWRILIPFPQISNPRDGVPALDLWDLIVLLLGNTTENHDRTGRPVVCPRTNHGRRQSRRVINDLDNVDLVPSNVQSSRQEALLYVFEDNEAVIKMITKGRSPTMRHVSRTHRVALDWLFDRINLDSKIQIQYIDTKNQLADMLTKRTFHTWWVESFVVLVQY